MNYLKRAMLSLRKQPFKTSILFGIIFLLTGLTATAITIRQAIINTDVGLRAQLPPVVTLRADEEKLLYYSENQLPIGDSGRVTADMVKEIGRLPHVRAFDFSQSTLTYSSELERLKVDDFLDVPSDGLTVGGSLPDIFSLRSVGIDDLERFSLNRIYYHEVLDIQSGLLELVEGRPFLPEEIEEGRPVIMLSDALMEANHLKLGDTVNLDFIMWRDESYLWGFENVTFTNDRLLEEKMTFEIVGVFTHQLEDKEEGSREMAIRNHVDFLNLMYVPTTTIDPISDSFNSFIYERDLSDEEIEVFLEGVDSLDEGIVFLLHDPVELLDFKEAAQEMIPEFWTFSDLSNAYEDMSTAMAMMLDISDGLFVGATLSTIASLGLLVLMFLRERQYEIGIYLSLGDRKRRIMAQLLTEVVMISMIAVTFSLLMGHVVASKMTEQMIQTELVNQAMDESRIFPVWANSPESLGFSHHMTHEDMLELYDATMNVGSVLTFYVVALTTVLVATLVPIVVTVNRSPKDLLLLKDV